MVTIELALGLGALMVVLALGLTAIGAAQARSALCEQVRVEARSVSLGVAPSSNPQGAVIGVADHGEIFTVSGQRPALELGGWRVGTLRCELTGVREPIPWMMLPGAP